MDSNERYKQFIRGYEKLVIDYGMEFAKIDLWGTGVELIEVYDNKEKRYVKDLQDNINGGN